MLGSDRGHLAIGAPADVCIFDPDAVWQVQPQNLRSKGKNTPFLGYEVQGRVRTTLVDGALR